CRIGSPSERAALADFMTAMASRYAGVVHYWILYNEPDNTNIAFDAVNGLGGCFGTSIGTTPTQTGRDDYALMLESAGAAIHAADPQARVVAGSVVSGNYLSSGCPTCLFDLVFLKGVMATLRSHGTLGSLDAVSVHYFSSQAGTWGTEANHDLLGRITALR